MSAAEIIEQLKALPEGEREEVIQFVRNWTPANASDAKLSREERFRRAADKVFAEHHDLLNRLAQ